MKRIQLKDFASKIEAIEAIKNLDGNTVFEGVSIDSRSIGKNEIFVAVRGERFDAHRFVQSALENGAAAAVVDREGLEFLKQTEFPAIVVKDTIQFLMQLGGWYRRLFDLPLIGLTGSAGKTTVKEMISACLSAEMKVLKTEGNKNNFFGVPLTLFNLSAEIEAAVVEIGTNHPGEIAALTKIIDPTDALITNIGSGHIGFFGSKEEIYREKTALFNGMKQGTRIFLNRQDSFLKKYRRPELRVRTIGADKEADYHGEITGMDSLERITFRINGGDEIRLRIPGTPQFQNGLIAGAVALDFGLPYRKVKQALENLDAVDKRMQLLQIENYTVVNDTYNSSPESLKAAIDYLCNLKLADSSRKFLVLGNMLELGDLSEKMHRDIGYYLADKPLNFVYCYGNDCRLICEILKKNNTPGRKTEVFEDHESIAKRIRSEVLEGDVVLIKGARGMAMENVLSYLKDEV